MAASIFSPPRGKPKIKLTQPTLAVGMPFIPPQVIPTAVNLVGDDGTVYGRMGENGQEAVSVTPSGKPTNDPAGGPNYASGGSLLIGAPPGSMQEAGNNLYPSTIGTGIFSGGWTPPVQQPKSYPQTIGTGVFGQNWRPPTPAFQPPTGTRGGIDPSININPNNPNSRILGAQQAQLLARRDQLAARDRTLGIQQQMLNQKPQLNQMSGQINNLQTIQNLMNRGVYQQQGMNQQQKLAEDTSIYRASKNTPDLTNVAMAKQAYKAEDKRASQLGVSAPEDVNLPPEYNGPLPAGARPKIMSQEERLQERAGYERPIREGNLDLMRTGANIFDTEVKAAQLAKEGIQIGQNELQLALDQAKLDEDYAQLGSTRADLDVSSQKLEPFPGAELYTNPETGEGQWVTPWRKSVLTQEDQKKLQARSAGTKTKYSDSPYYGYFSQSELEQMLAQGSGSVTIDGVMAELISRYPSVPYDVIRAWVMDAYSKSVRSNQSTVTEVGAGNPVPTQPTTPRTTPATAPTGQNSTRPGITNNPGLPPGVRR